jgi:hypothetical protein
MSTPMLSSGGGVILALLRRGAVPRLVSLPPSSQFEAFERAIDGRLLSIALSHPDHGHNPFGVMLEIGDDGHDVIGLGRYVNTEAGPIRHEP